MNISTRLLTYVIPGVIIGGILLGGATGWWQTESSKVPARYSEADYDGEFTGVANPADIRGSYSLGDIQDAFAVPVSVLAEAFLLTDEENLEDVLLKEFEERYGVLGEYEIGTDAARLFVARYLGLPYEAELDTGMFQAAFDLVAAQDRISSEEIDELRTRIVTPPLESEVVVELPPDELPPDELDNLKESEESDEFLVKGNTTFGELLTWGVAESDIRALLDGEIGQRGEQVRTWCIDRSVTYSVVKEELQQLVDEAIQ